MNARINSCRNCGECLEIMNTCVVCEKPIKFQCPSCFHYVDDHIHTGCMIFDEPL